VIHDSIPARFAVRGIASVSVSIPALLLGLGVLLHLCLLISLRADIANFLFNDSMHRFGPGCDFFSIYAAGVKARLGESVYTVGGHVEQVPYAYAFRYAPIVAYTLGLALSWLPHLTAYGVWLCLCELALLQNIRLTLGTGCRSPRRPRQEAEGRYGDRERKGSEGVFRTSLFAGGDVADDHYR
jgi:hypothetical protein